MYRLWHSPVKCCYLNTMEEVTTYSQIMLVLEGHYPHWEKVKPKRKRKYLE